MQRKIHTGYQPFRERQILDSSKLKEFADNNFNFDGNDRKFFERVENTVIKGEILGSSNFSFSHSVFKKTYTADMEKPGLVLERVRCKN